MIYLLYIILGLLPSTIWLLFYLRKDKHPESNSMVLKIFFWGMIIGPIAVVLELFTRWLLHPATLADFINSFRNASGANYAIINVIFAAPLIEEGLKYAVVKFRVLKNSEFDEPLDAMLYMIIAALGFAAIENLLLVFQKPLPSLQNVLGLVALRFVSATFLHALSSGLLGYWLARSIREPNRKFRLLLTGFFFAISFHVAYNFLVWLYGGGAGNMLSLVPAALIFALIGFMAIIVSNDFSLLRRLHSVCRICLPRRQAGLPVRSQAK